MRKLYDDFKKFLRIDCFDKVLNELRDQLNFKNFEEISEEISLTAVFLLVRNPCFLLYCKDTLKVLLRCFKGSL